MQFYLGIDFGTSGARAITIDPQGNVCATAKVNYDIRNPATWQPALLDLITQVPADVRHQTRAIAIDATSGTVLLCDRQGRAISDPFIYSDACSASVAASVRAIAPAGHTVLSATSSFAKLVQALTDVNATDQQEPVFLLHHADWLGFFLHNRLGVSDYHSALKLGYDVEYLRYPDWLLAWRDCQPQAIALPEVLRPGSAIGTIRADLAVALQLPPDCTICAGTTDSTAAFLASAGSCDPAIGTAVTSLGSTLVLKVCSQVRVEDLTAGIYSHRLDCDFGCCWLVGGGSNTGGIVLKQFFTDVQLRELSDRIPAHIESQLDYYPLIKPGERFPINDPNLQPRLEPRPDDPVAFLHGLLESLARIEARGYGLLANLGASSARQIHSAGGGAANAVWTQIRQRHLPIPLVPAVHPEAAYGAALLARQNR